MSQNFIRFNFKLLISFLVLIPKLAYAYIDPASGSMVIQALLAVLAAVSVSVGLFWQRIRSFIARLLNRDKNN